MKRPINAGGAQNIAPGLGRFAELGARSSSTPKRPVRGKPAGAGAGRAAAFESHFGGIGMPFASRFAGSTQAVAPTLPWRRNGEVE